MKDILGLQLKKHQYIINKSSLIFERSGYNLIQQNILEQRQVFQRTLGEYSDIIHKEMYSLKDLSGSDLVLRPEGTSGIMRHILEKEKAFEQVEKYYYFGPMYRYERPQLGRYRQFNQMGIEYIHRENQKNSYLIDSEIILLAIKILEALQINQYELQVNTLGDWEDRTKYNAILKSYFEQNKNQLSEISKIRLKNGNALRILDSKEKEYYHYYRIQKSLIKLLYQQMK
ncbi:hypothetical protein IMG5_201260 [Ichthyophthirius multifiliis]|uniref:histidine--tRNA ligase n=1 Tax=Ichthyophthirius multifiliis TaxID=5932 RepID=G0R5Y0_ICHMU|nr:hypothetical protein IMG5_201260 [Ichthyophthirius multifiliis]EGR27104.1 hypothetical protein IMG5_201260 [Ichthyophthirius multifiliis]|eukprot:XP_004023988.1 hypothetical protein IMG5_201260 [Ichthyophthirius multifiliis]